MTSYGRCAKCNAFSWSLGRDLLCPDCHREEDSKKRTAQKDRFDADHLPEATQ